MPSRDPTHQLFEDRSKAGLLEMMIRCEGFRQPSLSHHSKRDAVRQMPRLVGSRGEKIEAGLIDGPFIINNAK